MNKTLAIRRAAQRGVTMVEFMVSMGLALLVTLAAIAALVFARQGSNGIESAGLLRDNARFATDLVRRVVLQSGFESLEATANGTGDLRRQAGNWGGGSDPEPDIQGFNNSIVAANPFNTINGSRSSGCGSVTDTSCVNGSDVLGVRYQGQSIGGVADGSAINCAGIAVGKAALLANRPYSAFHVARSVSGEPTLMCTYNDGAGAPQTVALIEGVESFQVLYGVDYVTPGAVTTADAASAPGVVTRYLRADEMVVAGNASATRKNWRRVRSLRIGMVVRGPVGSAVDRSASAAVTLRPLGVSLVSGSDPGSALAVPADGRLRQVLNFTVQIRNSLETM